LNRIELIQEEYRKARANSYAIFDIEGNLKSLAERGLIYCLLHGMKDLTESEEVLISHYWLKYRDIQNYDDLV
jgi:hypothetical protein